MKMKNMLKKAISLLCVIALIVTNFAIINHTEAKASGELAEISWEDFEGAEYDKTYNTGWEKFTYKDTSVSTLNNTKFTGRIQFSEPSGIRYGGSTEFFGLQLTVINGNLYLWSETFNLTDIELDGNGHHVRSASDFGIASGSFAGEPIELTIVMTNVSDTEATVGVWVNNIAVDDSFTMTSKDANTYKLGTSFCIMDANTGGAVTIPKKEEEEPILPPAELTEIGWNDFEGAEAGKTYNTEWEKFTYKNTAATNLNNTRFTGKIQFSENSGIRFGGSSEWFGLHIFVVNGKLGLKSDTFALSDLSVYEYEASQFGISTGTFADAPITLTITMTNVTEQAATVGVWVNGIAVDESFTMTSTDVNSYKLGTFIMIMDKAFGGTVTIPGESPVLPPTDLTEIGWKDFEGAKPGKTYNTEWEKFTYKNTAATNLNNTRFTGKIQFSENSGIRFGGSSEWFGLHIFVVNGKLGLKSDTFALSDLSAYEFEASQFGITSGTFADTAIKLTITMTNVTEQSATVGIWVNDIPVDESFTMTSSDANSYKLGTYIMIMDKAFGGPITIPEEQNVPSEPEVVLADIDWSCFEGAETGKTYNTEWEKFTYKNTAATNLNNTRFTGKIQFSENSGIRFGGSSEWFGLHIFVVNGKLGLKSDTFALSDLSAYEYEASQFGISTGTFADAPITLTITMTNVTEGTATVGLWVNDIAVDESFTMTSTDVNNYKLGTYIMIMDKAFGGTITIPDADDEPVVPPVELTEIGWKDFEGAKPGKTYSTEWEKFTYKDMTASTLNNTKFIGQIRFSENSGIRYGGSTEWFGLHIFVVNGKLGLKSDTFALSDLSAYEFDASQFGISTGTFANTEFKLTISMTNVTEQEATVGIWVNDIAVDESFIMTSTDVNNYKLGTNIMIMDAAFGGPVTISGWKEESESVPKDPIAPPKDFTTITIEDFDGQIESTSLGTNTPISGQLQGVKSYDRTLFDVDLDISTKTPGNDTYIRFGGESDGWVGISVQTSDLGVLRLVDTRYGQTVATYNTATAGVDFYKAPFNLKASFEYVDVDKDGSKDDVKVGVYFNDVLYNNTYTYFKDFTMTNWFLAYTDDGKNHPMRIRMPGEKDPKPVLPPTDLKVITFSSFGIDDADFTEIDTTNFCAKGQYRDMVKGATLDGTLFHGKVKFSTLEGCQIRYGGLETPWLGLILGTSNEEIVSLWEAEMDLPEKEIAIHFMASEAGTTLTGKWLDLKMSTEFVDYDGDGKKDDVKFGIWFNDRMYRNTYYYFVDYAPHMGSYMCIYSQNEDSPISIRSVAIDNDIDLGFYGFSGDYRNWFSDEEEYVAKGEPLGVTDKYETVDYELDTSVGKVEVEDTDVLLEDGNPNRLIVIWITAGVLGVIAVFLIIFFAKKSNKGGKK